MELPASGGCNLQNSKKRVFPEVSSCMEAKSTLSADRSRKWKNKMIKHSEGVNASSASSVVQLDSEDDDSDSHNGKDYMDLCAGDYDSEDEYATLPHIDDIDFHTGNKDSVPQFPDSVKMKNKMNNATEFVRSTCTDNAMVVLNSQADLDTTSQKHNGIKIEPSKSTKISVGIPSFQSQKGAMRVSSVRKILKVRLRNMSFGPRGSSSKAQSADPQDTTNQGHTYSLDPDSGGNKKLLNVAGSCSSIGQVGRNDEVLRKYRNFKKFDIVEDHSDHHYSTCSSEVMQPPRKWAKKIQEEWRILEKALPDTIFVRVYESRMDLLRAMIMGAEGTPYHDGLFFFDVCFPTDYPCSPPQVHYHSGGLRINPNLYHNGKVCLSLLNTWSGAENENWRPETSTILQVLVSIQGLILNAKPFFNEPGHEAARGSVFGEHQAWIYNERTVLLSLKTMVYTMKNPIKHFEDMVIGHFRERAHAILTTCKAYTKGGGVGCEERGSGFFKADVERYMTTLVGAFKQIGVKDIGKFVPLTKSLSQKIKAFFGIEERWGRLFG